jgi:hypothetical protein
VDWNPCTDGCWYFSPGKNEAMAIEDQRQFHWVVAVLNMPNFEPFHYTVMLEESGLLAFVERRKTEPSA